MQKIYIYMDMNVVHTKKTQLHIFGCMLKSFYTTQKEIEWNSKGCVVKNNYYSLTKIKT